MEQPQPVDARIPLELLTERARNALAFAEEEARGFDHNYIGTEHILLGLLRETGGVAAKVLGTVVGLEKVRSAVCYLIGRGERPAEGEIKFTPRCFRVFELAVDEAAHFNHLYLGTEHLLLGMIREGDGIGARVLQGLGVNLEQVRWQTVLALLHSVAGKRAPEAAVSKDNVVTCRVDDRALGAVDALIEAGIRTTRSDAAAWLIGAGIEANRPLFEKVQATVAEIRRLRQSAQDAAQELAGSVTGSPAPATPPRASTDLTDAPAGPTGLVEN